MPMTLAIGLYEAECSLLQARHYLQAKPGKEVRNATISVAF
jgi:hypothetical protein